MSDTSHFIYYLVLNRVWNSRIDGKGVSFALNVSSIHTGYFKTYTNSSNFKSVCPLHTIILLTYLFKIFMILQSRRQYTGSSLKGVWQGTKRKIDQWWHLEV